MSRAVAIITVVIAPAVLSLPVSGSIHVFDIGRKGTAAGRGGHHLRGDRSLPLTPPFLRGNPDLRDFREADGGVKAEGVVIASEETGVDLEAPLGHKTGAGVFEALQGKMGHGQRDKNKGDGEKDQDQTDDQSAAPNNASDPSITALASVAALAIVCFGWCCLSTLMVWISICVCKRRDGQEDDDLSDKKKDGDEDVIRATVCGTLASVVCVSDSVSDDGEARPTSQPCTPRSSSAVKPNPDKAAGGVGDDGNIITPFVFRRVLKAVVATSPTSHGGSECCDCECTADKRRESESPQTAGSPFGNMEEEQKRSDVENAAGVDCQESGLGVSGGRGAGERRGEGEASNPAAERCLMSWVVSNFTWSTRRDGAARQASTAPGRPDTMVSSSGISEAGESRTSDVAGQRQVRSRVRIFWDRIRSHGERGVGPPLAATGRAAEAIERPEGESKEVLGALCCETAPPSNRTMASSSFRSTGGATALACNRPKDDIIVRSCCSVVDMEEKAVCSRGGEVAVSSSDLPRAKVMWRAFSEVDHARVNENHRRSTQRHLAVFNMVPAVENPPMCYTPYDA